MPQEKPFSLKIKELLYNWGFTKYGVEIVRFNPTGSPEWFALANKLVESKDMESRKLVIQQLASKGLFEKFKQRDKLIHLMLVYLKRGIADEKRALLKFMSGNPNYFSKDDDSFTGQLYALQRDRDMVIANTSEEVLRKLGFEAKTQKTFR